MRRPGSSRRNGYVIFRAWHAETGTLCSGPIEAGEFSHIGIHATHAELGTLRFGSRFLRPGHKWVLAYRKSSCIRGSRSRGDVHDRARGAEMGTFCRIRPFYGDAELGTPRRFTPHTGRVAETGTPQKWVRLRGNRASKPFSAESGTVSGLSDAEMGTHCRDEAAGTGFAVPVSAWIRGFWRV